MHIRYYKNRSFMELENSIMRKIDLAKNRMDNLYKDKNIVIPDGKYKGRWAKFLYSAFTKREGFLLCVLVYEINSDWFLDDVISVKMRDVSVVSDSITREMIKNYKNL